jgi:putative lipoic acid-binding regulatory protein
MRMHRSVVAVLAFCLLGLVPFATTSSADASVASQELAAPARTVKFEFKQTTRTTYKFYGKVQAAQNKKIILLHSATKKGKYRPFKKARTSARGNYSWKGLHATGYFYVKVPKDANFATSYSQLIHVFYHD